MPPYAHEVSGVSLGIVMWIILHARDHFTRALELSGSQITCPLETSQDPLYSVPLFFYGYHVPERSKTSGFSMEPTGSLSGLWVKGPFINCVTRDYGGGGKSKKVFKRDAVANNKNSIVRFFVSLPHKVEYSCRAM